MSKISRWSVGVEDPIAARKRVVFRPATASNTIKVGQAVCYNSDIAADVDEKTSNPVNDHLGGEGTTYAEGVQSYTGRMLIVEQPASGNLQDFAGIVAALGPEAGADGDTIEIYVPNGAMVPVWTNANCTRGSTILGPASGSYIMQVSTSDGDPAGNAIAQETVDRSSTNGLVWAKVYQAGVTFTGLNAYFAPTRAVTTGDASGVRLVLDNLYTGAGTGGPRTWGLYITGDKESGVITVAGADDAALRISVNNYVANAEIFNWRGINVVASNRDGGIVGELDNVISVSAKSGSTNAKIWGLNVDAQSLSADTADEMIGLDVSYNREGGVSTEEAGIRIRTRGTINTAVNTAIRVSKDATDHGFINLFNIETDAVDVIAASGDITFTSADKLIPIVFNGTTYYLVATDNV
jgi:hypothetical protein